MSRSRLLSGRVSKRTGPDLDAARYEFLDLANAEPDLGQPNFDGAVLISDADGTRYWTDNIRIDLTGNIYVGTISNSDGSSAIRILDNVLVEDNLTVQGILTAPSMLVSTINTEDSSPLTVATGLNVEGDLTVSDFTVKGNLTVQGTTTTINSTTLTVADKNIELASGATTSASADGAGITVLGPTVPANIVYDGQQDRWKFNKDIETSRIVGYLDGSARDIDNTAITNKQFATELDANLDQVFVYDVSEGQLKKTYLSEIVSQGSDGFTGSQGEPGFTGSQGELGFVGSQGELGFTGSAGFTGSFGFTGSRGEQGYTGSAGLDGYTGSRGDDGTSVKIVGVVATANDLPDPYNGDFGDGYIVTDTGNLWTWTGTAWVEVGRILGYTGSQGPAGGYTGSKGEPGVAASFTTRAYTGDGSTTEFSITEGNTIQTVMVFLNGVNQRPTDDYTVAGSTLTFITAPSVGELIIIREMPQAATGYTGSQSLQGFTGSQGIPGEAAAIGYTGSAGFTGSEGYTGSKGEQGTPGSSVTIVASVDNDTLLPFPYNGNIGDGYITKDDGHLHVWDGVEWDDVGQIVGYTGSRGTDGFVGSRGDTGYTGSTGLTGAAGQGLDPWTKISANYSASTGKRLIADTSGGSFTVTLPLNPTVGDYIQITDAGNFFLTPLIIDPNGEDIEGAPDNISVDIPGITIELIYDGVQWQITSTTGPQGEPGYTGSAGIGLDSITLLQSGNLTVLAGTVRWYAPYDLDIVSIKTRLNTAADGTVSIVINKNDQLAVNLSISANNTAGTEYITPLSLLEDDYLTVDVTTIGSSSAPGVDLYVSFKYQPV